MEPKSLIHILWQRLVHWIDRHTFAQLVIHLSLVFLAGYATMALVDSDSTVAATLRLLQWHHTLIPKATLATAAVFRLPRLLPLVWGTVRDGFSADRDETVEGVPVAELIDHLFTVGSFKRDEIEAKFRLPRYRVTELTKHLKRVGLLTHGENNMSVFNRDFSRQDVASILRGKTAAAELEPLFRKTEGGYTSEPSAKEIEDRNPLPPTPRFEKRTLAANGPQSRVQAVCSQGAALCAAA